MHLKHASKHTGRSFIIQQDNAPKHTAKTTKKFIKGKEKLFPDFNSIQHALSSKTNTGRKKLL